MKKNSIFGAGALLLAGAAIGAGAAVTQSAVADTPTSNPAADSVIIGRADVNGQGFQCTFSGADAQALILPQGGINAEAGLPVEVTGSYVVDASNPGPGVQIGASVSGATVVGDSGVSVESGSVSGTTPDVPVIVPSALVNNVEQRAGTPEECSELLKDVTKP